MQNIDFEVIKVKMQEIIDLIAKRKFVVANQKLSILSVLVDDFFDFSDNENDLREIGRYQVLILQLQQKIK